MIKISLASLSTASLALALSAATAFAAPCAVGTTTSTRGPTTQDTSSNVQGGTSTNVTPGAQKESPGTVGALIDDTNRTQPQPGERKPPEGKVVKPGSDDC